MTRKRVGILGSGTVGAPLARYVLANPALELSFVFSRNDKRLAEFPNDVRLTSQNGILDRRADLIVEAAHADLVKAIGLEAVQQSDLLIFSVTALANDDFRNALQKAATNSGHKIYLPHGAIIGIDGLVDAGPTLQAVTITTTKSPASLGLPSQEYKIVYEGPTRDACAKFPRNVNVHAMIALAGVGFDRTVSRIVADPAVNTNSHLIEIAGTGYRFKIEVSSEAGGKVSGAYTPQSALSTLQRICNVGGGYRFV
jgi:aspartate dehydrogenase